MDIQKVKNLLEEHHQAGFRLEQIKKAIFRDGVSSFSEIPGLPKALREILDSKFIILPFDIDRILVSKDGRSRKALLKLIDGNLAETVLISPKPGFWSACISSQAGCPLGCRFCATGKIGLKRDLAAEEITGQVLFWRGYIRKHKVRGNFSNIVYMGMGEPFLNWKNVRESLEVLTEPDLFGFGSRSISISTSGIPRGIDAMSREFPQVNLAISLHFADDAKRSQFMPVNRRYDLKKLKAAIQNYLTKTKRRVFFEYVMLAGINDGEEDVQELVKYLKSIGAVHLIHVNLIRYNAVVGEYLRPSSGNQIRRFKDHILRNGIGVTIRKSLGEEIRGACGQLSAVKEGSSG